MWRAPVRGFLLVLVVVGVAVLSLAVWARYTVNDQDQFVSVVGGLSTNPAVQKVAVEQIMVEIDRQIATRTASQGLSPTVSITYQMFRPQIESGVLATLQSPQFKPIWIQAIRELHDPLSDLLKGEDTPYLTQTDGQVQVNLYPAYELAKASLPAQGVALLDQLNITPDSLQLTVLKGSTLVQIQDYIHLFNRLLIVGIIVSVLSAIGYVMLSSRKLRAVAWLLLAVGFGWLIQRLALEVGKNHLVDALRDTNERTAAQVFYDTLVGDLRVFELYALIVAIGAAVFIFLFDRYVFSKLPNEVDTAI